MTHSSRVPSRRADGGAAAPSRRRRIGKRVACAVIFCGAAAAVGIEAGYDVQTTDNFLTPASVQLSAHAYMQEICIYNLIRREVPEGARVYVNSRDVGHMQRLAELSTLWAVPQAHPATAKYLVSIHRGDCFGVRLRVRRI